MKLAYHSLGSIDTGYGEGRQMGYPEALDRHLEAVSRPDTEIELLGTTKGGLADSYRYFAGLDTGDVLANMMGLRDSDVDALVLGNIFDPGLREGRELLSIPVTGQLETSVLTAAYLADRCGIVSINDKQAAHSLDKLRTYQLTEKVAEIRGMNADISTISEAYADDDAREAVLETFEATAQACIDRGAELLVPGGGILSILLTEFDVTSYRDVPIMDQVAVSVAMTETLVDLYAMGATETSPVGTFGKLPAETVDDLQSIYDL